MALFCCLRWQIIPLFISYQSSSEMDLVKWYRNPLFTYYSLILMICPNYRYIMCILYIYIYIYIYDSQIVHTTNCFDPFILNI